MSGTSVTAWKASMNHFSSSLTIRTEILKKSINFLNYKNLFSTLEFQVKLVGWKVNWFTGSNYSYDYQEE